MRAWYQELPGNPTPEALGREHMDAWPASLSKIAWKNLQFCPVAFSELHLLAHHLPIIVVDGLEGPQVLLDLRSKNLVRPPFDQHGEWMLQYIPLALRLLPFAADEQGNRFRLQGLQTDANETRTDLERKTLRKTLIQYAQGRRKLSSLAESLIERGYLTRKANTQEYRVNTSLAARVDVAPGGAVAFQVLVIMLFSMKNLIVAPDLSGFPLPTASSNSRSHETELDLNDFLVDGASIGFS